MRNTLRRCEVISCVCWTKTKSKNYVRRLWHFIPVERLPTLIYEQYALLKVEFHQIDLPELWMYWSRWLVRVKSLSRLSKRLVFWITSWKWGYWIMGRDNKISHVTTRTLNVGDNRIKRAVIKEEAKHQNKKISTTMNTKRRVHLVYDISSRG